MSEVQIAIIDQENTQIALAVPGVQGPAGAISSGGSANQVFYKVSGTNYDAGWTFIGNANVDAAAAIAGTKISPNFGSQTVATTGVFSHALGSQGAPTITFTGDTNTGIYSPGADQVAISTGGSGRLFVDASGNIGLGITPVANTLIGGARGSSLPGLIELAGNGNTVGASGFAIGQDGSGVATLFQRANTAMYFATNGTERLRITSTGTVNIVGAGTAGSTQAVSFNGSAPVNSLVIDSSGRLGIGTSSVTNSANLDIQLDTVAATDTYAKLQLRSGNYGYIIKGGLKQGAGGQLHFDLNNNGTVSTQMVLDTGGRLGIGTTSPVAPVHIEKAIVANDTHTGAVILARTSNIGSSLFHQYSTTVTGEAFGLSVHGGTTLTDTTYTKYLVSQGGTHIWYGSTTSSERARIDSSGRLLVGTSTTGSGLPGQADQKFQVAGGTDGGITMSTFSADPYACNLEFRKSRSGSVGTKTIVQNGDTLGKFYYCGTDGANFIPAAGIEAFVDGTPGSNDMPGRLVFSTTADGASSPTERARIPNGGGLCVGSTVNPNALTQASGIRLGDNTLASYTFASITTSPVTIANGVGIGGLAFVQAFNTSTGAQYTGLIMWRSGVVAVVSESNALGFALTYSVSGSTLRLQTASGTISGSVITLAG